MPDKEKSKQCCTNSMGMGGSVLAVECWKAQINKENTIREEWRAKFAPQLEDTEREVGERYEKRLAETRQQFESTDDEIRQVLYDGVSKDGAGRKLYLKLRNKMPPQDKQTQPLTSSQNVGWKCSRFPPVVQNAATNHGRRPIIRKGFFRTRNVELR